MNNFWTVVVMFFVFTLVSQVSLSLGLTTVVIDYPSLVSFEGEFGFFDALAYGFQFAINNIGAFIQLITFQTGLPIFWNTILILPYGMGAFYLVFVMIRGGAS